MGSNFPKNKGGKKLLFIGRAFFLCLFCINGVCAYASEEKRVVLSAIENEQTHAMAKNVVREAYARIGWNVRFKHFPAKRALESANMGVTDGDVARIEGTEKIFTNLIPTPTPVIYFQGVAFTKNVTREIKSWKDLKGLRVGVIRGIRYSEIGAKGLTPFFADDMTHLFKLLDRGRLEIAVAVMNAGRVEIEKNFKNSGIHVVGAPLYRAPLYHFVHKRHAKIVDDLDGALREMAVEGEIDKILKRGLKDLLKNLKSSD